MKLHLLLLLCLFGVGSFAQPKKFDIKDAIPLRLNKDEIKYNVWLFSNVDGTDVWTKCYKPTPVGLNSAIYDMIEGLDKYDIDVDNTLVNKTFGLKDLNDVVDYHKSIQTGYAKIEKGYLINEERNNYIYTIVCSEELYLIMIVKIKN
jgi:hypothetical protein